MEQKNRPKKRAPHAEQNSDADLPYYAALFSSACAVAQLWCDDVEPDCGEFSEKIREYFTAAAITPLYVDPENHNRGSRNRVYSLRALCLFLGLSVEQWRSLRGRSIALRDVMRAAEDVIRVQQLEGCAAGLFAGRSTWDDGTIGETVDSAAQDITDPRSRLAAFIARLSGSTSAVTD